MDYTKGSSARKREHNVDKIFLDRWSPRAMSGEEVSDNELMTLFEAARWAPSSNNEQPWRFIYAKRGTSDWDNMFSFLGEFNQLWTKNASVLACLISKKKFADGTENRNHMSDAGAAWQNLALQASLIGLVCHGMAGYDVEKARKGLDVHGDFDVVHMFALGKPAVKDVLPERMQKSEHPNDRKPLKELLFEGKFKS